MTDKFKVPRGATVYVGAPAVPMDREIVARLAAAVAKVEGVREAHLPQAYIPSLSESPAQLLVLVLSAGTEPDYVADALAPDVHAVVPTGAYLDIWPLGAEHELLPAIRAAGCQIFGEPQPLSTPTRWWQFWRKRAAI